MKKLLQYVYCYTLGCRIGFHQAGILQAGLVARLKNALKGGNLSICFQGFIPQKQPVRILQCAEIGALAATFDLISDDLKFSTDAHERFNTYCRHILSERTFNHLSQLLHAKKDGTLQKYGLERGVYAVEIIFSHMNTRDFWAEKLDIETFGLNSQIADDILDYEQDIKSDHLNFLKHEGSDDILINFVEWDYQKDLEWSEYPHILRFILRKSKKKGNQFLRKDQISQRTHTPIAPINHSSEI